jgi:hypothetical protein
LGEARGGLEKGLGPWFKEEGIELPYLPSWSSAMPRRHQPEPPVPVKLSQAQRKAVAEVAPDLADRLKLDERNQRTIRFTLDELRTVKEKAGSALRQAGPGRKGKSLRLVFASTAQALEGHTGRAAQPAGASPEWFLAEVRAIAGRYRWQYVAPDRQAQVEQIAYRLWQAEGCSHGRHEDHWRQAEQEFHADKPIRGTILDAPHQGQAGQLLSPLQAVVHTKTGVVYPVSSPAQLAEAGFPVTAGELAAIEAAADATPGGYDVALRAGIAKAVGLER